MSRLKGASNGMLLDTCENLPYMVHHKNSGCLHCTSMHTPKVPFRIEYNTILKLVCYVNICCHILVHFIVFLHIFGTFSVLTQPELYFFYSCHNLWKILVTYMYLFMCVYTT